MKRHGRRPLAEGEHVDGEDGSDSDDIEFVDDSSDEDNIEIVVPSEDGGLGGGTILRGMKALNARNHKEHEKEVTGITAVAETRNLGVKRGPFYVLVGAGMPCVLVEVSFLTNPEEGERLADHSYRETIAEGLLRGIRRFVENTRVAENL